METPENTERTTESDATTLVETSDTFENTNGSEEVNEKEKVYPQEVGEKIQNLIRELEEEKKSIEPYGRWNKSKEAKQKLVELYATIIEYYSTVGEVQNLGVNRKQIQQYSFNEKMKTLSEDEELVLGYLQNQFKQPIEKEQDREKNKEMHKHAISLLRLHRKKYLDNNCCASLARILDVPKQYIYNWEASFREIVTADLVPELFKRAQAENNSQEVREETTSQIETVLPEGIVAASRNIQLQEKTSEPQGTSSDRNIETSSAEINTPKTDTRSQLIAALQNGTLSPQQEKELEQILHPTASTNGERVSKETPSEKIEKTSGKITLEIDGTGVLKVKAADNTDAAIILLGKSHIIQKEGE